MQPGKISLSLPIITHSTIEKTVWVKNCNWLLIRMMWNSVLSQWGDYFLLRKRNQEGYSPERVWWMNAIISVLGPFYLYAPLSLTQDIHPQDHKMAGGSLTVASILQEEKRRKGQWTKQNISPLNQTPWKAFLPAPPNYFWLGVLWIQENLWNVS